MPSYLSPGVYVEEVPSSSASLSAGATAIAAFVGFTDKAPKDEPDKPRLVTSWSQYEALYGGFAADAMLPNAVYGWFNNGGSVCYIVRVPHRTPSAESGTLALKAADKKVGDILTISSQGAADGITVAVTLNNDGDEATGATPTFNLVVTKGDEPTETYEGLTVKKGADNNAATKTKDSKLITVAVADVADDLDIALALPKPGNFPVVPAAPTPLAVTAPAFAGSETARKGINGLVIAEDVTIVLVPDLVNAAKLPDGKPDPVMWKSVQSALITHCELQANRMAILDPMPGMTVQEVKDWRSNEAMYDSAFAAMYYPWVKVANPLDDGSKKGDEMILVPPSGHIAGLWARTDNTRGVWKAPANDTLRGVLELESTVTMADQTQLNPIGINCIRPFGTRGIRVWGARTLADPTGDWRYINVRRLFNMIETTIMQGTQYAVFEPNDVRLWEGVKRTLNAFLRGLWRDGALFGATPEQAFFVKCDSDTNPPDSIDEGKLIVEVGIAPVKPAEFVIFRISQFKDNAA
ncbi:MAG: phage tail sheath subtilisin-like domain-containing protein [Ilumatobacteraceae bacterium]